MTAKRISTTEPFGILPVVAMFQSPYIAPARNENALTGRKMRSGLKSVTTLRRISRNLAPSCAKRIFERPARRRAWTGSKATL